MSARRSQGVRILSRHLLNLPPAHPVPSHLRPHIGLVVVGCSMASARRISSWSPRGCSNPACRTTRPLGGCVPALSHTSLRRRPYSKVRISDGYSQTILRNTLDRPWSINHAPHADAKLKRYSYEPDPNSFEVELRVDLEPTLMQAFEQILCGECGYGAGGSISS
jgi:hypothetical protein